MQGSKNSVLLAMRQPEKIKLAEEMIAAGKDMLKGIEVVRRHPELYRSSTIEGTVRYGLDDNEKDREEIRTLLPDLAGDYAIIEDHVNSTILGSLKTLAYALITLLIAGTVETVRLWQSKTVTPENMGSVKT